MKLSSASARMRLRSSEGWKAKSKPASVLTVVSRDMRSAVLTRRLSRKVSSSSNRLSSASTQVISPCSTRRRVASSISSARGILSADEALLDAVEGRRIGVDGHDRPSEMASRLPTAW